MCIGGGRNKSWFVIVLLQFSGFSVSKSQHTTHYRHTRCGSFFATFFTDLKNHERGEENTLIHKDCGGEYKQNQNLYAKRLFTCRSFFLCILRSATYVSVSLLFAAIDRFVDQRRYVRTAVSLQTAYKSRGMRIGEHSLEFYKNKIWKTEKSRFPFFFFNSTRRLLFLRVWCGKIHNRSLHSFSALKWTTVRS